MLIPWSNVASPDLVEILRRQGAHVETVTAYDILPVKPHPVALASLLDGGVDIATFVSPSGVTGLAAMLDGQLFTDVPSPLRAACLGPATANAARAVKLQVDVVTRKHTIDGLLEALVAWHTTNNRGN
jgi:uroporphyrinogen-III synthase